VRQAATSQNFDPLPFSQGDQPIVISPSFTGGRVLALIVLIAVSVASQAQSADTGAARSVVLKPKPGPADDVGGSWNWFLAGGRMTNASLVQVFLFNYGWDDATLVSGEIGYTLKDDNPIVRFLDPVVSSVDVALNLTYQDDSGQDVFEIAPYIMARWSNFPWSNTVRTTFGLGGGLSYATPIPSLEKQSTDANPDYENLMHYIAIEATFALPSHKDWQLVYRLHHRSGVFGLMQGDNSGTTAVELGIRHYFK
jgi:hypothetical protein